MLKTPGGGTPHMKGVGMLVGNFELNPKKRPCQDRQYIYFYIFSRATLNETFTAKYDGVLPITPYVRPNSEIYTPKRDDENLHPCHMRSPPGFKTRRRLTKKRSLLDLIFESFDFLRKDSTKITKLN